ncbi:Altered inheritance of mitochondria protein 9, mitochondrial [Madurella mycetomatis]|uniref:Altered inheritance of mitochondria protein 9, mitochondrial n=1 Tax=Madurella mycetomatis TaxID=100816 RepID=A0A175WBL7_9PEZI|nr:Altered inheritance of mitochondria protein 9, mitochondrial [Madurella mycetomatis]
MSSQNSEDLDTETFGPLLSIPESSLVNLAVKVRADTLSGATPSSSSGRLGCRIGGSSNLLHIIELDGDFKLVIRITATGWGDGLTATAAHGMESQVATLRLIASMTTIPVPQVYAFDITTSNSIGAPYIYMSFVPGQTLATAWFDATLPTPLEDRCLKTLTSLSRCLAQLAQFSFAKIGSIHKGMNGDLTVGPCYDWKENEDGRIRVIAPGPYDTAAAYLRDHYAVTDNNSPWKAAATAVAKAVVRRLPFRDSSGGFVPSIPDIDSQNIMVD